MSLVNDYRKNMRENMGLPDDVVTEDEPIAPPISEEPPMPAEPGASASIDEATMEAVLEMIKTEIAKKEGQEAMTAPTTPPAPVGANPINQDELLADDIYFEMLSEFKKKVATCKDENRRACYERAYKHLYKVREKFIGEMSASVQPE